MTLTAHMVCQHIISCIICWIAFVSFRCHEGATDGVCRTIGFFPLPRFQTISLKPLRNPFLARLLILIKKGGLLQLKFVGVNIYLWAR